MLTNRMEYAFKGIFECFRDWSTFFIRGFNITLLALYPADRNCQINWKIFIIIMVVEGDAVGDIFFIAYFLIVLLLVNFLIFVLGVFIPWLFIIFVLLTFFLSILL